MLSVCAQRLFPGAIYVQRLTLPSDQLCSRTALPSKPAEHGTGPAQGWTGHKDGLYLGIQDSLCPGTMLGSRNFLTWK